MPSSATTNQLTLGRGKVFFTPYAENETTGGIRGYLGASPTLSMAINSQNLDHFSAEGGLKVQDKAIILQSDMTVTFPVEDVSDGNLALWFGGNNTDTPPSDLPIDIGDLTIIGNNNAVYGALEFWSDNAVGQQRNFYFPYVCLQPNGNFDLKGDQWQQMGFQARVLKRDENTARLYVFNPTGGASQAAGDTTARLSVEDASIPNYVLATVATITASTPQVHGTAFPVVYDLDAGELAYLFVHNGSSIVAATRTVAIGNTGTVSMTIPSAGTTTLRAFDNPAASGTALGTSSAVVAS